MEKNASDNIVQNLISTSYVQSLNKRYLMTIYNENTEFQWLHFIIFIKCEKLNYSPRYLRQ